MEGALLRLSSQGLFQCRRYNKGKVINKNTQEPKSGMQEITETMSKTRCACLLPDGPLRNSSYSFGEGHLDCLTDESWETRET